MKKFATCTCTVIVSVGDKIVETKTWKKVGIMRTSHTRAWATRQFNRLRPLIDTKIFVEWECMHDDHEAGLRFTGSLARRNSLIIKRGIFDD